MFEFWQKHDPPKPADPKLLEAVRRYVDEHFEPAYDHMASAAPIEEMPLEQAREEKPHVSYSVHHKKVAKAESAPLQEYSMAGGAMPPGLEDLLNKTDAGFSETLLKLIDETGEKDSAVYKRANVDRKLFSKIRSNPDYRPSKSTAVAFALALRLNLKDANELIGRAGYVLSHSSKADLIAEYFIENQLYDIGLLNEILYANDLPLIGGTA